MRALGVSVEAGALVEAWRMPDGTVWAYSYLVGGERWLELPEWGAFCETDTTTSRCFPRWASMTKRCTMRTAESWFRSFQTHGGEVLHASAVRGPLGVVAFCADSLGGKSTMAYAMGRGAYRVWADDAVAIDFSGARLQQ